MYLGAWVSGYEVFFLGTWSHREITMSFAKSNNSPSRADYQLFDQILKKRFGWEAQTKHEKTFICIKCAFNIQTKQSTRACRPIICNYSFMGCWCSQKVYIMKSMMSSRGKTFHYPNVTWPQEVYLLGSTLFPVILSHSVLPAAMLSGTLKLSRNVFMVSSISL